jgi:TRAP-type mannitol/chloroaromatic compound transport system permease small subunit
MKRLLPFAHAIDTLNNLLGRLAVWAVFVSCMVSAGNATIRYLFDSSSNAWLEMQWYLFAGTVLLGAAMTLRQNEHVRVDLLYGHGLGQARAAVDRHPRHGLLPAAGDGAAGLDDLAVLLDSFIRWERSSNAGGLIRWPVKILMPLGFALLSLQGLSELVKRIAALRGKCDRPRLRSGRCNSARRPGNFSKPMMSRCSTTWRR